jgi:hypothetical protein
MGSIFPESLQGIAQLGIGGVSLITGIISTIGNFLEYANINLYRLWSDLCSYWDIFLEYIYSIKLHYHVYT